MADTASLVERLRRHEGIGAAMAPTYATGRHIAAVMDEAAAALEAAIRERDEAHKVARDLTKALVGLTPSGSEYFKRSALLDDYFADTERCVAVIRDRFDNGHRARLSLSEARAEVERLRAALTVAEAVLRNADGFETTDDGRIPLHSPFTAAKLARAALQQKEA